MICKVTLGKRADSRQVAGAWHLCQELRKELVRKELVKEPTPQLTLALEEVANQRPGAERRLIG